MRVVAVLVALLSLSAFPVESSAAKQDQTTCEDFQSWEVATANMGLGFADPKVVDPDSDGIACEELPSIEDAPGEESAVENQSTPSDAERSLPLELAPGLSLTDYRILLRPEGRSIFLGEIRNDTDQIYDSPDFTLTYVDTQDNVLGEERVFSVVGFMRPGESDFLVARAEQFDPATEEWDSFRLSLFNEWGTRVQIQYTYDPALILDEVREEEIATDSYSADVFGLNTSSETITGGAAIAVFRDANGRFIGYVRVDLDSPIPSGKTARFRIRVDLHLTDKYNPFEYLEGSSYTVKHFVRGRAY